MRHRLSNSKQTSAIINGMLLYWKAIDLFDGLATICEKCHSQLILGKIPLFSLNNLMWLGDVPSALESLTITEQKLIALVRTQSNADNNIYTGFLHSIDIRIV